METASPFAAQEPGLTLYSIPCLTNKGSVLAMVGMSSDLHFFSRFYLTWGLQRS